jgi:hypothetical protein
MTKMKITVGIKEASGWPQGWVAGKEIDYERDLNRWITQSCLKSNSGLMWKDTGMVGIIYRKNHNLIEEPGYICIL